MPPTAGEKKLVARDAVKESKSKQPCNTRDHEYDEITCNTLVSQELVLAWMGDASFTASFTASKRLLGLALPCQAMSQAVP